MELQSEQEKLNTASQEMIEEHNRKQKHIEVSRIIRTFESPF